MKFESLNKILQKFKKKNKERDESPSVVAERGITPFIAAAAYGAFLNDSHISTNDCSPVNSVNSSGDSYSGCGD